MNGVKLDRDGRFKAKPTSWALRVRDSGAVCVSIGFDVVGQYDYDTETWIDWPNSEVYVYGDTYIVKKDGSTNMSGVEQLQAALGWDGDPDAFNAAVPDVVCQITVKPDVYKDQTTYKVAWLDRGDAIPKQGMSGASDEQLVSVKERFGGALRAAAAAAKAKAPMVVAKAPAAPAAHPAPTTAPTTGRVKSTAAPTAEEVPAAWPSPNAPPLPASAVDPVTVPEGSDEAAKFDDGIPF